MHLSITEDLTQAKNKAKKDVNNKVDKIYADILAKTHFVNEVHRLKNEELSRYNKDSFLRNPNNFPFIKMEAELANCTPDESAERIRTSIEKSKNIYIDLEKLRQQTFARLRDAQTVADVRSAVELLDNELID